jgi:hypothetical protein
MRPRPNGLLAQPLVQDFPGETTAHERQVRLRDHFAVHETKRRDPARPVSIEVDTEASEFGLSLDAQELAADRVPRLRVPFEHQRGESGFGKPAGDGGSG